MFVAEDPAGCDSDPVGAVVEAATDAAPVVAVAVEKTLEAVAPSQN